jgi:hypothetical protein
MGCVSDAMAVKRRSNGDQIDIPLVAQELEEAVLT